MSNEHPSPRDEPAYLCQANIAALAAQLLQSAKIRDEEGERSDIHAQILEATRQAILLLEAQECVRVAVRECGDPDLGLLRCKRAWEKRGRKTVLDYKVRLGADGRLPAMTLEKGLAMLMPHDALNRRESFFRDWLFDDYLEKLTEDMALFEKRLDDIALGVRDIRMHIKFFIALIAKQGKLARCRRDSGVVLRRFVGWRICQMRRHGIPASVFFRAMRFFAAWKAERTPKSQKKDDPPKILVDTG